MREYVTVLLYGPQGVAERQLCIQATDGYGTPQSGRDPADAERLARLKQSEEAAASSLFFRSSGQKVAAAPTSAQATPAVPVAVNAAFDQMAAGPASTVAQSADPTAVQNRQVQKEGFLNKAGSTETRNSGNLQMPASPYQVMAGTVIAAALVTRYGPSRIGKTRAIEYLRLLLVETHPKVTTYHAQAEHKPRHAEGPSFANLLEAVGFPDPDNGSKREHPVESLNTLLIGAPFEEETIGQDCRGDVVDVLGRHCAGEEAFTPMSDHVDEPIDFRTRVCRRQPKTPCLRQQVVDTGCATVVAHAQRKVAPLQAHHRCRHQIVGWGQPPSLLPAQQGMVARVIVVVGHGSVEDHPPEQFSTIGLRLVRPAAQVVSQQWIGPTLPVQVAVAAVEHGQPADETEAQVTFFCVVAIKALQHQHITGADRLEPRLRNVQAAATRKVERREFDTLQIEAIVLDGELAEPKELFVLDRGLRTGAAHAGAGIELFEQMRGHRPPLIDRLGCCDQFGQLVCAVVLPLGRGRFGLQPETQVARPVLRSMQQIVDFLKIGGTAFQFVLDHAPSPGIGAGVPHRPRNALELCELEDRFGKRQLKWIERDRLLAL